MKMFEFQSLNSIHNKSLIVDDDIAVVGSFNLDSCSMYLSTKTMLFIHSEEFTSDLDYAINNYIDQSLEVKDTKTYYQNDKVEEKK